MLANAVEGTELVDPLGRKAVAYAGHTGNIVGGFASECRQIRILCGSDFVFVDDGLRRHMLQVFEVMARVQHGDVVIHQLESVSVTGQYQCVVTGLVSHGGEGGDHVVAFESRLLDVGDAEGREHALNQWQLGEQLFGSRLTGAFVLRKHLIAECAALHIEGDAQMVGLLRIDHLREHGGKTPDGVGGLAAGGAEVVDRQGEKCTEGQRVAVHHQQCFIGGYGHAGLSHSVFVLLYDSVRRRR